MTQKDALILTAAGSARRFGQDKLTLPLLNRPLFAHALIALAPLFQTNRRFIAVAPERLEEFQGYMAQLPPEVRAIPVPGGDTRFQSVFNALKHVPQDTRVVAVHDAARPVVNLEAVRQCIQTAARQGAAVLAHPVTDTIKVVDPRTGLVSNTPPRDTLWAAETPQVIRYDLMRKAFQLCQERELTPTDDVQAVELAGEQTVIVPNHMPNPKVTFPDDLILVRQLLQDYSTDILQS